MWSSGDKRRSYANPDPEPGSDRVPHKFNDSLYYVNIDLSESRPQISPETICGQRRQISDIASPSQKRGVYSRLRLKMFMCTQKHHAIHGPRAIIRQDMVIRIVLLHRIESFFSVIVSV